MPVQRHVPESTSGLTGRNLVAAMPAFDCHQHAWKDHRAELHSFLTHRSGNPADADDLLQEIFLRVVRQGKAFCGIENPRAWLFQVARHLIFDRYRVARDTVPLPDDLMAETHEEAAAVDRLTLCLPRVLDELPPADRDAIIACDLEGMTQQDFARRHGLTLSAAKSRVQRARQRLRDRLTGACQIRFDAQGQICCFTARPPQP